MKGEVFAVLLLLFLWNALCHAKPIVSGGGPGERSTSDMYNAFGVWNRTYGPTEPQQIHLAWLSEGTACRVQFATASAIDHAVFRYWPQGSTMDAATVILESKDVVFVDGGEGQHTIYLHSLESQTLSPATLYTYQVGSLLIGNTVWSDTFSFHTPSLGDTFQFLATADMGTSNAVSMPNLRRMAALHKYDFITMAGDQAYDMADFNGTKGDEYMNFVQDIYATIPVMAAPGNHEHAYNFSHYKSRFDILPYRESGFPDPMQYSFNYKSLHFVVVSSEVFFEYGSEAEIQTSLRWLEADLAQAAQERHLRPWIIVMAHRPLYCSPSTSDVEDCTDKARTMRQGPITLASANTTEPKRTGGLEDLLLKYRVDVYLCGHRHNYERTFPVSHERLITRSYRNAPSFFQLGVGNAGNFEGTDDFYNPDIPIASWSARRFSGYGFSTVKVTPTTLDFYHHESRRDGSLGGVVDHVRVTKSLWPQGTRPRQPRQCN